MFEGPYQSPSIEPETSTFDESPLGPGSISPSFGCSFIRNDGQISNREVQYYLQGQGLSVGFARGWFAYNLQGSVAGSGSVVQVTFLDANPCDPIGIGELCGDFHFFLSSDETEWTTGVRSYQRITYPNLYEGIDLVFHIDGPSLKYEFHVQPRADADQVGLGYHGATGLEIDQENGDLLIHCDEGVLRDHAPVSYQRFGDSIEMVDSSYTISPGSVVSFQIADYDPRVPLVIDPGLTYSTYVGGDGWDSSYVMEVDSNGSIYIAGWTNSTDFPTNAGAYNNSSLGTSDAYVMKMAKNASSIMFTCFIGSNDSDWATNMVVDDAGYIYLVGNTKGSTFPTTPGANDTQITGDGDESFLLKLNPNGTSLVYSTLIGGDKNDYTYGLCVDSLGRAYVSGLTGSSNFYVSPDAYQKTFPGSGEGFALVMAANGSQIEYSTILGGKGTDDVERIWTNGNGTLYLAGYTYSTDFPVTVGAFDTTHNGKIARSDMFVTKLNTTSSKLEYSTFIGGWGSEWANTLDIDNDGNVIIGGSTSSTGTFPTTQGVIQSSHRAGITEGFLLKLNSDGSDLVYSTYFGGTRRDLIRDVLIDTDGSIYIAGQTESKEFHITTDAYDSSLGGDSDGFIAKLNASVDGLYYCSYIGGSGADIVDQLALDVNGELIACVETTSNDFPTTSGAFDGSFNGGWDLVVLNHEEISDPWIIKDNSASVGYTEAPFDFNFSVSDNNGIGNVSVDYWFHFPADVESVNLSIASGTITSGDWNGSNVVDVGATKMSYICYVNDTYGNVNMTKVRTIDIEDITRPYFTNLTLTDDNATTGDRFKFCVTVDDNIKVMSARVVYWYGDGSNGTFNMTMIPSATTFGLYEFEFSVLHSIDPITYLFQVVDYNDNWNFSGKAEVTVHDNDAPTIEMDHTVRTATTGDAISFKVKIADNIEVDHVNVTFWIDGGPTTSMTMDEDDVRPNGDGVYVLDNLTVDPNSISNIRYRFTAWDATGNQVKSQPWAIRVTDDDPVELVRDYSDEQATTGDNVSFMIEVEDNIAITEVLLTYYFGIKTDSKVTVVMMAQNITPTGNGSYITSMRVPFRSVLPISYYFTAADTSGNLNQSDRRSIAVSDNDRPWFPNDEVGPLISNVSILLGELLSIEVEDNIGIEIVRLVYWYEGEKGNTTNVSMVDGVTQGHPVNTYIMTIDLRKDSIRHIHYEYHAKDTSGNWNHSRIRTIVPLDDIAPSLEEDLSDTEATTGDPFHFVIQAYDNVGISKVIVELWFLGNPGTVSRFELDGRDIGPYGRGTYVFEGFSLPPDSLTVLVYRCAVIDTSNNSVTSADTLVYPVDNDPPTFGNDMSDSEAFKGHEFNLSIESSDNIGLQDLSVRYWFTNGTVNTVSIDIDGTHSIDLPRAPYELLNYQFIATDYEGNNNTTGLKTIDLANLPPVLSYQGPWTITEGNDEELDLSDLVHDGNDPLTALSLCCTHPHVTISGLTLRISLDVWTEDFELQVSVSDGEDSTSSSFTVRVINVNDPPEIQEISPPTGSKSTQGKKVLFEARAVDEDGDPLTYRWTVDGEVISEDLTFEYKKLPKGTNTVLLVVSDGVDNTTESIEIKVTERKDSTPGSSLPLAIIAVMAISCLLGRIRSRR